MKSLLKACACAALTLSLFGPALASAYPNADQYFTVRDRGQVLSTFRTEDIQTQPDQFAGKLIEVRGIISAVAGSDAHATILVTPAGLADNYPIMLSLPPGKTPASWPFLDVGVPVRVLCQVVKLENSRNGALEIVLPVKETEAAALEQERARELAAKKEAERAAALRAQKAAAAKNLSSRGIGTTAQRHAPAQTTRYTRAQLVDIYGNAVRYFNKRITPAESKKIAGIIIDYSIKYGLDARLVMAVIAVESNFNSRAVSPAGAQGLGQLMPGTASGLGVGNPFDVEQNLEGSTRLLSNHIRNMTADGKPTEEAIKLALACYNAGAGAVKKYKGVPPYRETRNYIAKITRLYRQFCGLE